MRLHALGCSWFGDDVCSCGAAEQPSPAGEGAQVTPTDGGVQETARLHSADCRRQEEQRRREAGILQAGFESGLMAAEGAQETPKLSDGWKHRGEMATSIIRAVKDAQRVGHTFTEFCELARTAYGAPSLPPERAALVEQLKALADDDDTEQRHMDADAALLNYINDSEISAAFHAIKKWYA